MIKTVVITGICACLALATTQSLACDVYATGHTHFSFGKLGFRSGALVSREGLAADRVFKLKHTPIRKVPLGEESEIVIDYERPLLSTNVVIEVSGSDNVEIVEKDLELSDFNGSVRARFLLTGDGYDAITLTVSGDYKGGTVSESSTVRVGVKRVKKPASAEGPQVTSR